MRLRPFGSNLNGARASALAGICGAGQHDADLYLLAGNHSHVIGAGSEAGAGGLEDYHILSVLDTRDCSGGRIHLYCSGQRTSVLGLQGGSGNTFAADLDLEQGTDILERKSGVCGFGYRHQGSGCDRPAKRLLCRNGGRKRTVREGCGRRCGPDGVEGPLHLGRSGKDCLAACLRGQGQFRRSAFRPEKLDLVSIRPCGQAFDKCLREARVNAARSVEYYLCGPGGLLRFFYRGIGLVVGISGLFVAGHEGCQDDDE